jgi:glyoxalase family protein
VPGIESEPAWVNGEIPAEHAIRGFHSASLLVQEAAPTGAILTDIFGFTESPAKAR